MTQNIHCDRFYILRRHITATFKKSPSFGGKRQGNRRPRTSAILDKMLQFSESVFFWLPGRKNEIDNIIPDLWIDVDRIDNFARGHDIRRIDYRRDRKRRV